MKTVSWHVIDEETDYDGWFMTGEITDSEADKMVASLEKDKTVVEIEVEEVK